MASCEIETRVLARALDVVARRAVFVTLAGRIAPAGAAIVFIGWGCIHGTLGGGEDDEKRWMVGDHGVASRQQMRLYYLLLPVPYDDL